MNVITAATEKRINEMVKIGNIYGNELLYLLNTMKSNIGWYGATIKEIKNGGEYLKNYTQFDVVITGILRGMGINFEKNINVVGTHDLHYVTIRDFNLLVKKCSEYE